MTRFTVPALLAGPIVRRVESNRVVIWLATSRDYHVSPEFFAIHTDNRKTNYVQYDIQSKQTTVRLGKRLLVHLLTITPAEGLFPTNQLLGYNLQFTSKGKCFDLQDLGLLSADNAWSIVYGELKFPSFLIKGSDQQSHILYGSCRKVHGEGDDTLLLGDSVVENNLLNIENRPNALFLMGDQIYADDVPDPLVRIISTFSRILMGRKECLQEIDQRLCLQPFKESINQINGRQFIMDNFCKFTSTSAHNHLIEFGEYAVLYLLSWSPALWELAQEYDLFASFDEALDNGHIYFNFPDTDFYQKGHLQEKKHLKSRYQAQQDRLISFQHSLYKIARLFANIPVYMIFDDHDITDDWNISLDWMKNVRRAPLGRHVVSNGLASYWAFQGWGNNPDVFESSFISTMTSYFESLMNGKIKTYHNEWARHLWNFNNWKYIAPTTPTAVFLDTRTQRKYELAPKPVKMGSIIEETNPPPQLINNREWRSVEKLLLNSGWERNSPLIIVSTTPVYGMGLIESFLHDYVYQLKVLGVNVHTKFDFEAWKYNGKGFSSFLHNVTEWEPSLCIILSGDVHYGSAVHAAVEFSDGRELKIEQYTASPFKNMSFTNLWGFLMKLAMKVNSFSRTNRDIYRYCDSSYHIQHIEKGEEPKDDYLWKDKLRYQPVNNRSIIEIENHLGLLSHSPQSVENRLLKYQNMPPE